MATTARVQCLCSSFEFGTYGPDGSADSYEAYTTGCTETTTKTFAMGHDAKLVGYLVRAELAGEEIRRDTLVFAGAVQAARTITEALALKAQAQLDAARARLLKKASREAAKTARKSAKIEVEATVELAPIEAMIKVGRWTYPAQIDRNTREATYKAKLGGTKTAAHGTYTVI